MDLFLLPANIGHNRFFASLCRDVQAKSERRVSKGALVRRFVRDGLTAAPRGEDPLLRMSGADSFDPEPVDDVVYR